MGFGITRAVPVEIVTAFAPSPTVVFTQHHHEALPAILLVLVFVGAAQWELPTNLGLGLNERDPLLDRQMVQGAAVTALKILIVVKNTGTVDYPSFIRIIFLFGPAFFIVTDVVVLPQLRGQFFDPCFDSLFVFLLRKVRAMHAAARVGLIRVNALATATKNAIVFRGQPCEIATNQLIVICRVDKFNPLAGEIKGDFSHCLSLGQSTLRRSIGRRKIKCVRCDQPVSATSKYCGTVRLGVLDIGSNTVHSLVVDAHYGGAPIPADKRKLELGLAQFADSAGVISAEAIDTLIEFIVESQITSEKLGVSKTIAFATSAIRDAPNQIQLRERVEVETGVQIDVLSGETEAELTFLAARRWVGWSAGRLMIFDIGGGSLELAVGDDEEPDAAASLPLGAGLLTREFITVDPPSATQVRDLRKYIRAEIAAMVSRLSKGEKPRAHVGTSKTFKQLARIAGAAESSTGIYVKRRLSLVGISQIIDQLVTMDEQQRQELPGVSPGRSGQMLAGALVAEAAMELFRANSIGICPWALREGVILRALDSMS